MNAQSGPSAHPTCTKCQRPTGSNYYTITQVEGKNRSDWHLCSIICLAQFVQFMTTFKGAQLVGAVRAGFDRVMDLFRGPKR